MSYTKFKKNDTRKKELSCRKLKKMLIPLKVIKFKIECRKDIKMLAKSGLPIFVIYVLLCLLMYAFSTPNFKLL